MSTAVFRTLHSSDAVSCGWMVTNFRTRAVENWKITAECTHNNVVFLRSSILKCKVQSSFRPCRTGDLKRLITSKASKVILRNRQQLKFCVSQNWGPKTIHFLGNDRWMMTWGPPCLRTPGLSPAITGLSITGLCSYPQCSNVSHQDYPNVGKYSLHGAYDIWSYRNFHKLAYVPLNHQF